MWVREFGEVFPLERCRRVEYYWRFGFSSAKSRTSDVLGVSLVGAELGSGGLWDEKFNLPIVQSFGGLAVDEKRTCGVEAPSAFSFPSSLGKKFQPIGLPERDKGFAEAAVVSEVEDSPVMVMPQLQMEHITIKAMLYNELKQHALD